ncbi:MAG: hypothetical protein E7280_06720 [Lachnospiraceae bacterium]|nr:hypothetical protein [Lachnospiraceae bacterium]
METMQVRVTNITTNHEDRLGDIPIQKMNGKTIICIRKSNGKDGIYYLDDIERAVKEILHNVA